MHDKVEMLSMSPVDEIDAVPNDTMDVTPKEWRSNATHEILGVIRKDRNLRLRITPHNKSVRASEQQIVAEISETIVPIDQNTHSLDS